MSESGFADPAGVAPGRPGPLPPGPLASVALDDHAGVTVATVRGEIDMSSVDHVAAALTGLSNLALGLVIDLREVEYLDSSGISLLHDLALRLQRRAQKLVIVCPSGSPPRRMLELTAVTARSSVLDDLEPAIEAIRSTYGENSGSEGGEGRVTA